MREANITSVQITKPEMINRLERLKLYLICWDGEKRKKRFDFLQSRVNGVGPNWLGPMPGLIMLS